MRMRILLCLAFGLRASVAPAAPASPLIYVQADSCLIGAPAADSRALEPLAARAREIFPRLEAHLGARPAATFRMLLIPPGAPRDSGLAALDRAAPPWAAGYLLPERRIGAIRMAAAAGYPYGSLESVLAHEATHMILHDAVGRPLPRWFDEGVATWEGRRWSFEDAWVYSSALLRDDVPPLEALDRAFSSTAPRVREAYAASFSFVSWAQEAYGEDLVRDLLRECRHRRFDLAWRDRTGSSLFESERSWRRENLSRVRWITFLVASNVLWIGITLLALTAGIVRRRRARRARATMPDLDPPGPADEDAPLTEDWP